MHLTLANPVNLPIETYWVEITNVDNSFANDDFYWESGIVDPPNGIFGFASFAFIDSWSNQTGDLAIEITAEPLAAAMPTFFEWGMMVISLLIGVSAIFMIRRRLTVN